MRKSLVIAIALLGCGHVAGGKLDGADSLSDYHIAAVGNATECGGLASLSHAPDKQSTEIRIWIYGEMSQPHTMYRFVAAASGVTGETFAWWSSDRRRRVRGMKRMVQRASSGWYCREVSICGNTGICQRHLPEMPDWPALFERLAALNVLELPDESLLPETGWTVNDGETLIIELLRDGEYRSYAYHDQKPSTSDAREAANAWKIVDILAEADMKARGWAPG